MGVPFRRFFSKLKKIPDVLLGFHFHDPEKDGEYRFIAKYIKENMTIFDVGANIGNYTRKAISITSKLNVYCFEPVKSTFNTLNKNLESAQVDFIKTFNFGFSDKSETLFMNIYGDNAGSNSLYYHEYHAERSKALRKEEVSLKKLDDFILGNNITSVDFLKIDVEGHEFKVLLGALQSLESNTIKCIQFEYNDYWKKSGYKLENVIKLLSSFNFSIYRLTPWGKLGIGKFEKSLENYKMSNYLALKRMH
jgi:FkbM family methyltransferase